MNSEQLSVNKTIKRIGLSHFRVFCLLYLAALLIVSCSTDHLPLEPDLTLSVEDVSCTEVWLKAGGIGSHEFILERDGGEIENYSVISENIIYDDSLQPNTTYSYRITRLSDDERSRELIVITLDTTSHDWSWEIIRLGGSASSALYDVAILTENDIWAVGAVYDYDSTGKPDPHAYNAIHWDGENWKLGRIFYSLCPNGTVQTPYSTKAVLAFSENDIWFTRGSSFVHWDGNTYNHDCSVNDIIEGSINKIWGTSGNNFYIVGYNGSIAHYDGRDWHKIDSGTDLDVVDIYGAVNPETGCYEILAVASRLGSSLDREILRIDKTNVKILPDNPISEPLSGIWFVPGRHYFAVGSGIYEKHTLSDKFWTVHLLDYTTYYTGTVRGNAINDVLVAGSYGEMLHFNGISWKSMMAQTGLTSGSYGKLAIQGNLAIAVGHDGPEAVIAVGRR